MPKGQSNPTQPKPKTSKPKNPKPQNKSLNVSTRAVPAAKGAVTKTAKPKFTPMQNGNTRLRHCELVSTITGTDAFTTTSFNINAGLSELMSWLSVIAGNYESYKFHKLRFRYVHSCSSTTTGNVYLTVDFDPQDPPPYNERQMSNYQGTVSGSPWTDFQYDCTQANLSKRKSYFVRNSSETAPTTDLPLYDTGVFTVATVGTGTAALGKIWVEYDVELQTPDFKITAVGGALNGRFNVSDNFVSVPAQTGNTPLTATVNANVLTLTATQPYAGLLAITVAGAGLTTITVGGTGTETVRNQVVNSGGTSILAIITLDFDPGETFTLTSAAGVPTAWTLRIGQYDQS